MEALFGSWIGGVAFLLGLGGGAHCAAMCGGIAGALARAEGAADRPVRSTLLYNVGRIASYTVAGGIAGSLGFALSGLLGGTMETALRVALGALIVVTGLAMAGFSRLTAGIEAVGARFWRRVAPLSRRITPRSNAMKLLAMGALWGWLPCGLVYAALAAALATGSFAGGSLFMLCFGLGTLPALVAAGTLAGRLHRFLQAAELRRAMALLVVCYGVWTLWGAVGMGHAGHGAHGAAEHVAMDHGAMDHASMDHAAMGDAARSPAEMDHAAMGHAGMGPVAASSEGSPSTSEPAAMEHAAMGHAASGGAAAGPALAPQSGAGGDSRSR